MLGVHKMSKCIKIIIALGAIGFVGYWVARILSAMAGIH
tara:strand:+ start:554 stop:670 length:117 start_codon:yes stop_codon:yes gene_type:complete